jgi:hypothetical protein
MVKAVLCALAIALTACAGDAPPTSPDAALPSADARTNEPFGAVCTVVTDTGTECASMVCTNSFDMSTTPLCSAKCTVLGGTDPVCPTGSMGQKCNKKGYCRP